MERKTLIMSEHEVEKCIDLDDVFSIVERVFRQTAAGNTILPPKLIMNLPYEDHENYMIVGPASVAFNKATGLKIITGYKSNPTKYNLPYLMSTMILIEHETGYPIAIMDATHLTNARTGGMVVVAAKYLAQADSKFIAFIGAGVQARSTAKALCRFFSIEKIAVFDTKYDASSAFKSDMSEELGVPIICCSTGQEAVEGSDIVITVTTSEGSFVMDKWLKPGGFVASLGTYQELDPQLLLNADKLVVDDKNQARYRGEFAKGYSERFIDDSMIHGDLGEIVTGLKSARVSKVERNIVCLTGIGTMDVAVAKNIYEKAIRFDLGMPFTFLRI